MCLSLFLLSYCILFKFPTVRFLRLYRRHRFAIRNRNQLEGNSGVETRTHTHALIHVHINLPICICMRRYVYRAVVAR